MYRTPDGYYDEFYIFPFDFDAITGLVRNGNLQNAVVPIPGGYDFILRRITGLDRIFTHGRGTAIGKFQFRTSGQNNVFFGNGLTMARVGDTNSVALNMADFMVIPELLYPGTGGIGFDIFNFGANMADIAAQAVLDRKSVV